MVTRVNLCRLFILNWQKFYYYFFLICSLYGFRDAVTIKNLDEAKIDRLENFIKNGVVNKIEKFETKAHVVLDKQMFFGEYVDDTEAFEICLGDRVQLQEVASYAKRMFEDAGPSYFSYKKNPKLVNTIDCGYLGRLFIDKISEKKMLTKTKNWHRYFMEV